MTDTATTPEADGSHAGADAPLDGVTVLDLTRLLPGPLAGMRLAALGAHVVKIEDKGAGDYAREMMLGDGEMPPAGSGGYSIAARP